MTEIDRRVRRTRGNLSYALLELMVEKGYDAITIQDLLDRANVGRTTFYDHYRDKDDLLVEGLKNLRSFLREHQRAAIARTGPLRDRALGFSLAMFEHAGEQRALVRAIVGRRAGTIVMQHVRRMFQELVRDDLAALGVRGTEVPVEAIVEFAVGSLMSILMWWADLRSNVPDAAHADAMFRRLTIPGILAAVGR
jgi:AcrR family transcriptional regulator